MGIPQISYDAMLDELSAISKEAALFTPEEVRSRELSRARESHTTGGSLLGAGGGALLGNLAAKALGKDRALGTLIGSLGGTVAGGVGGYHLGGHRARKGWEKFEKTLGPPPRRGQLMLEPV